MGLTGCVNPFVAGYSGQTRPALPDTAEVITYGAHESDDRAMVQFNETYDNAQRDGWQRLGSASFLSSSTLRDPAAAAAGRQLGARLVLYTYRFSHETLTHHTSNTCTHRSDNCGRDRYHTCTYRTWTSPTHWYRYHAYFFAKDPHLKSLGETNQSTDGLP